MEERTMMSLDELMEELSKPIPWYKNLYYKTRRGVRNIKYIPKEIKWFIQRGRRGYSDKDVWNLDSHIANVIASATKDLQSILHGHPMNLTFQEWHTHLGEVVEKFEYYISQDDRPWEEYMTEEEINEMFTLLAKHFPSMWD